MSRSGTQRDRKQAIASGELDPRKCGARLKSGGRCQQWHMKGHTRCRLHGALTPQSKRAAAGRLLQARAAKELRALGEHVEPVTDPIAALEHLAGIAMKLVEILRDQTAAMDEMRYRSDQGLEQIRGELPVLLNGMQRAESLCANIVRLGLDERRVQLDEARAVLTIAAFDKALKVLGLDPDQERAVVSAFQQALPGAPAPARVLAIDAIAVEVVAPPEEVGLEVVVPGSALAADALRVAIEADLTE